MRKVLLAMSGGVDSSTAAFLLRKQGYEVVGCTMQLWDYRRNPAENGELRVGRCCSLDDVYDARRVADRLGLRFYVLNLEKEFERSVVEPFIDSYLRGRTPIPCTACNTNLKFDRLLEFGTQVGIRKVATGHYARIEDRGTDGYGLLTGRDPAKDQSYFLFELTQRQLARIEFPVGGYVKREVRDMAVEAGLVTARKPDSQEICFIPDRDYAGFIRQHAGEVNEAFLPLLESCDKEGPVLFRDGTRLGTHQGIYRYTIGQRRGLGIAHSKPLYVTNLDMARNAVTVGYKEDVYSRGLRAERVNWISGRVPGAPFEARVKVRSNHEGAPARVAPLEGGTRAEVSFKEAQLAVTPGQAAVFYKGREVLGGGWIASKIP